MRLRRVLAIAERDLRIEFSGRRGVLLPVVVALMLLPVAVVPRPPPTPPNQKKILVHGDVPPEVAALPNLVRNVGPPRITMYPPSPPEEPGWRVEGPLLPKALTQALDSMDTKIKVVNLETPPWTLPERSLLLALLSASMLTGALAQSIPGERASRTLEPLRTASVSELEIVVGKWLAWTAFAGGMAMLAALVTVVLGYQSAGPWLAAMPWIAAATAAGGLWLVRRANDVVAGATVALRTQPLLLAVLGLAAWVLGWSNPLLGAAVPLGGALIAAGNLWEGWAPVLLAILSTAVACAACLVATARDLGEREENPVHRGWGAAVAMGGVAASTWWLAILGPMVWALGGASERTEMIPRVSGPTAGMFAMLCMVVALAVRDAKPFEAIGLVRASRFAWVAALAVGVVLPLLASTTDLWPMPSSALWADSRTRLLGAVAPQMGGPALLVGVIAAQELLLRGWMRRAGGDLLAAIAAVVVLAPLDPVRGALEAGLMGGLVVASGGAVLPAILARVVGAALSNVLQGVPAWAGVAAALGAGAGLWWSGARAASRHGATTAPSEPHR
jgi:hypothetical protein